MEMLDVIRRLSSLERYANACRQDAESCGDPIAVAEIYQHDAEALRAARAVLEGLEHHRAKAADVARAIRICRVALLLLEDVYPETQKEAKTSETAQR